VQEKSVFPPALRTARRLFELHRSHSRPLNTSISMMATGVSYNFPPGSGLKPFRAAKLMSVCSTSQSLGNIAAEEACDTLEKERSDLNLSLRSFDLGSIFQTAVEALVVDTDGVEEEEDKLLGEIAAETRKLEMLELEVAALPSAS
jgi:hypothetical protein